MEGLRKTIKNLRMVGVPAEIQTEHLPNRESGTDFPTKIK
jgi:hypothetical protein